MTGPGKKHDTGCPVAYGLDTFGDRWSLLLIRDLLLRGKETYGEFLDGDEKIATNILADRLKNLEAEGIVRKCRDPESGRRFLYSLTEKGLELAPTILEMIRWSGKHDPKTNVGSGLLKRAGGSRKKLLAELRARATGK